jgi:hypothetical protein
MQGLWLQKPGIALSGGVVDLRDTVSVFCSPLGIVMMGAYRNGN